MGIKETRIEIKDDVDMKAIALIHKSIEQFHNIIESKIEENDIATTTEQINIHSMISKMSIRWFNSTREKLSSLQQEKNVNLLNEDLDFMKYMFKFYYLHGINEKDKEIYDRAIKILNGYRTLSLV